MTRIAADGDADNLYSDNQRVGFYAASYQVAHMPSESWYFIMSFRGEMTYITQVAFGMTANDVYWRKFNIGTTGVAWTKIV